MQLKDSTILVHLFDPAGEGFAKGKLVDKVDEQDFRGNRRLIERLYWGTGQHKYFGSHSRNGIEG